MRGRLRKKNNDNNNNGAVLANKLKWKVIVEIINYSIKELLHRV